MRPKGTLFRTLCEIVLIMQEIRLDGFKGAVDSAKNIVITNHSNPDGDAMGSALALKIILENWIRM